MAPSAFPPQVAGKAHPAEAAHRKAGRHRINVQLWGAHLLYFVPI
jgi:hypothetical protein